MRYLFIWIVLASQEDEVLESVGQAVMVLRTSLLLQIHRFALIILICCHPHLLYYLSFCGQTEVTIDYRRLGLGQDNCKAGQLRSGEEKGKRWL